MILPGWPARYREYAEIPSSSFDHSLRAGTRPPIAHQAAALGTKAEALYGQLGLQRSVTVIRLARAEALPQPRLHGHGQALGRVDRGGAGLRAGVRARDPLAADDRRERRLLDIAAVVELLAAIFRLETRRSVLSDGSGERPPSS